MTIVLSVGSGTALFRVGGVRLVLFRTWYSSVVARHFVSSRVVNSCIFIVWSFSTRRFIARTIKDGLSYI